MHGGAPLVALSLAVSHVGIAASMEPVSAEPPISVEPIASLPTVEKIYAPNVYPFPPVTSLVEGVISKASKDVTEQDARDGERQRSPEPRVPRFPPTPTCLLPCPNRR